MISSKLDAKLQATFITVNNQRDVEYNRGIITGFNAAVTTMRGEAIQSFDEQGSRKEFEEYILEPTVGFDEKDIPAIMYGARRQNIKNFALISKLQAQVSLMREVLNQGREIVNDYSPGHTVWLENCDEALAKLAQLEGEI